jgi:pimeloyl-ACP methyl ester carboxylesterase
VILTDGMGCNGTYYINLIRDLSPRMNVVRWAHRGHGLSDAPRDYRNLEIRDMLQDLFAVMDGLGIRKAIHIGYSMGAQVVIEAAVRSPDRFLAMITLCGTWGRLLDSFHGNTLARVFHPFLYAMVLRHKEPATTLWRALTPTRLVYFIASLGEFDGRLIDRKQLAPYFEHLSAMDLELSFAMVRSAAEHDTRPGLQGIRIPTLVIGARRDSFCPAYLSEQIYEGIRGAELLIVPGATHSLSLEQPDLVYLKIEEFLVRRADLQKFGSRPVRRRRHR